MNEELIYWTERSSFLQERIGAGFVTEADTEAEERWQHWKSKVGNGSEEAVGRHLAWRGLEETTMRAALGRAHLTDKERLPEWASLLGRVLSETTRETSFGFLGSENPIPFQEVLAPIVGSASLRIWTCPFASLAHNVQVAFERQLLGRLSEAGSKVLSHEFQIHRAVFHSFTSPGSASAYSEFVSRFRNGEWWRLFRKYPGLARAFGVRIERWMCNTVEFLKHLDADRQSIEATFGLPELGAVTAVRPGLSDPHRGGRAAIGVDFESGFQCIYKPRNLATESALQELLAWMNDHGVTPAFHTFRTLVLENHGWSETVPQLPCENLAQVERYFERIGTLAALLHALGAGDCHHGNIIACGEFPVLIDTETLLTPQPMEPPEGSAETAAKLARRSSWHSVLKTWLLPIGRSIPGLDLSHAAGVAGTPSDATITTQVWSNPNSDWMNLRREVMELPSLQNRVFLAGEPVDALLYIDRVITGFERCYGFLTGHRDELLRGPLEKLRKVTVRGVCRATRTYSQIIANTLGPKTLRDGADAAIELEPLGYSLTAAKEQPAMFRLMGDEKWAMADGDIPLFTTRGDSRDITSCRDRRWENFYARSGFEYMQQCLGSFSPADLRMQMSLIRASFAAPYRPSKDPDTASDSPLSNRELVEEAIRIGNRICETAIAAEDGSVLWLTFAPYGAGGWRLLPMSYSMYNGVSGVALFLASLFRVTGDARWARVSRAALSATASMIEQATTPPIGNGETEGLGSLAHAAYALLCCSDLLGDSQLLQEARKTALAITDDSIAADSSFDTINGSAGAVLGLLPLWRRTGDSATLDRAVRCGEHLLEKRISGTGGLRTWATLGGAPLAGLAHGAAGIALALERLAQATGESRFRDAALEAVGYENSLFNADLGNWPDLRKKGVYAGSWCHGAAGIGLARLSLLDASAGAVCDVGRAVDYTLRDSELPIDHACCGHIGKAEFLLAAGERFSRLALAAGARRMVSRCVRGAWQRGHYRLTWDQSFYWASFHQGMAGIGYHLLRLAEPRVLPSVLAWE